MFDLHLLHLPPLNLFNINSYYSETHYERVMKASPSSPLCFCGEKGVDRGSLKEVQQVAWEERMERMKEMVRGR